MQMAADYKAWLQDMVGGLPEEEVAECRCLEVEYFIMRTALVRMGQKRGVGRFNADRFSLG